MLTKKQKCEIASQRAGEIFSLREKFAAERNARNIAEAKKIGEALSEKLSEMTIGEKSLQQKLMKKYGGWFYNGWFSKRDKAHLLVKEISGSPRINKYIILNSVGENITNEEYDDATPFMDGLAFVKKGNAGYFIDESGKRAFEGFFDSATAFFNGYCLVSQSGRFFIIDKSGRQVTKNTYDGKEGDFHGTYAVMLEKGKKILATVEGDEIDVSECDVIKDFDGEIIIGGIRENHKVLYFYLDKNGQGIGEETFEEAERFHNGFAKVKDSSYGTWQKPYYFIDKKGRPIVYRHKPTGQSYQRVFTQTKKFSEGVVAVKSHQEWMFMNAKGKFINDQMYDRVEDFSEGFAVVKFGEEYFFIDKKGRQLGNHRFSHASSFNEGKAHVTLNNKHCIMDRRGNLTEERMSRRRPRPVRGGEYRGALMLNPDIFNEEEN